MVAGSRYCRAGCIRYSKPCCAAPAAEHRAKMLQIRISDWFSAAGAAARAVSALQAARRGGDVQCSEQKPSMRTIQPKMLIAGVAEQSLLLL